MDQQLVTVTPPINSNGPPAHFVTPSELDDFKSDVRTWIETDNSIRRLLVAVKERRAAKKVLSERIMRFMSSHNIEDLDTKDGRIRYKVAFVRTPLTQSTIKERIASFCADNAAAAMANGAVFGNRDRGERQVLHRRLPPAGPQQPAGP
jgi:hypothetical protein